MVLSGFMMILSSCSEEPLEETESVFFKFSTSDAFEEDGLSREYWLLISDLQGQQVGLQKFAKGEVVEFDAPAAHVDGNRYDVTFFKLYREEHPAAVTTIPMHDLKTYLAMTPGDYILNNKALEKEMPSQGTHRLAVNNYPVASPQFISVSGRNVRFATNLGVVVATQPFIAGLTKPTGDVFYLTIPTPGATPYYAFVESAAVGQTLTINFSQMKIPETLTFSIASATSVSGYLKAVPSPGMYDEAFTISDNTGEIFTPAGNSTKLYFAEEMNYPEYITEVGWSNSEGINYYRLVGNSPATSVKELNAEIVSLNKIGANYLLETSGQYDFSLLIGTGVLGDFNAPNGFFFWELYASSTDNTIRTPGFPSEILTSPFGNVLSQFTIEFERVELFEYPAMAGYEEFLEATFKSNAHFDATYKEGLRKAKRF